MAIDPPILKRKDMADKVILDPTKLILDPPMVRTYFVQTDDLMPAPTTESTEDNSLFERAWFYRSGRCKITTVCDRAYELLRNANMFQTEGGYFIVTRAKNRELFDVMEQLGFFEYQKTNEKKQIAAVHQFCLFLRRGVWRLHDHPDELAADQLLEVHHLNSLPHDCRLKNLTYVTAQQNSLCADALHKEYLGLRTMNSANIRSREKWGGGATDTAKLIQKTIICTLQAIGFTLEQIPSVANILLRLPGKLGKEVVKHWRFQFNMNLA